MREAVLRAIPQLRGAYGTVIMDTRDPGTLLAARSGSPLVIGLGMGENFIASDQLALLPVTRRFIFLEEGDIAEVTRRSVVIFDKSAAQVKRQEIESNLQYDAGDKGIYRHYMQKEIFEQPNAIKNTLTGRISHGEVDLSELGPNANEMLAQVEHIQIVACGTSYNSGMVSRYWFEALAGVPCDVEIASEFRYRKSAVRRNSLMITLSQSGETADTGGAASVERAGLSRLAGHLQRAGLVAGARVRSGADDQSRNGNRRGLDQSLYHSANRAVDAGGETGATERSGCVYRA